MKVEKVGINKRGSKSGGEETNPVALTNKTINHIVRLLFYSAFIYTGCFDLE